MSQSLASILVHIIFSTKKRQAMILPEIVKDLYTYMAAIAQAHDSQCHEIGGIEDHVHLLIMMKNMCGTSSGSLSDCDM